MSICYFSVSNSTGISNVLTICEFHFIMCYYEMEVSLDQHLVVTKNDLLEMNGLKQATLKTFSRETK